MQTKAVTANPKFCELLSEADWFNYTCIRMSMSAATRKNHRNRRIENFTETLDIIRRFCYRGDGDDWKRCLVCGICWLPEGIAVNTRQLKLLIFKCKSSINGSLHRMGFTVNLGRTETLNALILAIPFLKDNVSELRQWTIRQIGTQCKSPISPPQVLNPVQMKSFEVPIFNVPRSKTPAPKIMPQVRVNKPLPLPFINYNKNPKRNDENNESMFNYVDEFPIPEIPQIDVQLESNIPPLYDDYSFPDNIYLD